jgi:23S rRNA A1618 N6-methylase RlmF
VLQLCRIVSKSRRTFSISQADWSLGVATGTQRIMEWSTQDTSDRKRRHPNSLGGITTRTRLTSSEILERVENPNFEELARQYPAFRQAWDVTRTVQKEKGSTFSSCVTQEFTITLTRALLQTYFQLKLPYLDEHHLCPPIPNRFFYLHWIHSDLLTSSRTTTISSSSPLYRNVSQKPNGLDIGSGASCIYSLLAARFYESRMYTTEIDPTAAKLARSNVTANHLSNHVTVLDVPVSYSQLLQQQPETTRHNTHNNTPRGGPLVCALEEINRWCQLQQQEQPLGPLDFVMTNPPFYDPNSMEHSNARVGDGRARTSMTVSEGTYPDGEVGFVLDVIEDSLRIEHFRDVSPQTWYSSMIGKKTSLVKLQKLLIHLLGPAHVRVTEYGPGQYTRWFLAWTLEHPVATAPTAACPHHDHDSFQISLATLQEQEAKTNVQPPQSQLSVDEAMTKIFYRILTFCESSPGGWDLSAEVVTPKECSSSSSSSNALTVHIQESMPLAITNYVDETQTDVEIPPGILDALQGRSNDFLPDEGHFLVQVTIRHVTRHDDKGNMFRIQLAFFRHSTRGAKAVEKIRSTIEGEVCRTNRKWRKTRQREQLQNQQLGHYS